MLQWDFLKALGLIAAEATLLILVFGSLAL